MTAAAMTLAKLIDAVTDRSIWATISTKVWPIARIASGASASMTSCAVSREIISGAK